MAKAASPSASKPKAAAKPAAAKKKSPAPILSEGTPAELGFRMPAEWEPQEAVWLSRPHNYAN